MMRSLLILGLAALLSGCGAEPSTPFVGLPRDLTPAENQLISSDNNFGIKLFKEINSVETDNNLFVSPFSVSMALGMTFNGAAGETEQVMRQVLGLGQLTLPEINESYQSLIELLRGLDSNVIFHIANSIWYSRAYTFEPEFIDLNKTYFDAEVAGLDFTDQSSVGTINDWVKDKTEGKIDRILDEIGPLEIMFLINAIYFKGDWTWQFDPEDTKDDTFTLSDGTPTACRMMVQKADLRYYETKDLQVVDLPYGEGEYSMTILLPQPEVNLDYIIGQLTDNTWAQWTGGLEEETVSLSLPKFSLRFKMQLNDVLKGLHMSIAFNPDTADFTRLYAPGGAYIGKVLHKTFVDVNEEGTEAAAVTSVAIELRSAGGSRVMRIDRPFLFVIRENFSGTILFIGKIMQPES
ncbi:serpin family protein [candidate division KSB1 bacterium]